MKSILFACMLSCIMLTQSFAQFKTDPDLKFDQPFTNCELKWVVLPPKANAPNAQYGYGFIYIDIAAGYTVDVKGTFTIDNNGNYVGDTTISQNKILKYRLAANTVKLALLPPSRFAQLHVQARPAWVNLYYKGRDTSSTYYNYRMGFILNGAGDSRTALTYLNKAYAADPKYQGLIFEISYAYNALEQYDGAIKVLQAALKNDPKNVMLFRELGYAYKKKGAVDDAINYYKKGIDLCDAGQNDTKAEMGYNLAYVYKDKGDDADYKSTMANVKTWASPNSEVYKAVVQQGF